MAEKETEMAKIDLSKATDKHGDAVRKSMQRGPGKTLSLLHGLSDPDDKARPRRTGCRYTSWGRPGDHEGFPPRTPFSSVGFCFIKTQSKESANDEHKDYHRSDEP